MKEHRLLLALRWLICTVISYVFVFVLVFYGRKTIAETFDSVFLKIVISVLLGTISWLIYEKCKRNNKK